MWDGALKTSAAIFKDLGERGIQLTMRNLGGGFPTRYLKEIPAVEPTARRSSAHLRKHFGNRIPETIIEPGRGMVGNAGIIEAEVVLISRKSDEERQRWVYLDIGKFNGLAETMDERSASHPHRVRRRRAGALRGRRPTCDSVDMLYEKEPVSVARQPRDRREGADRGNRRLHDDLFGGGLQRIPPLKSYVI